MFVPRWWKWALPPSVALGGLYMIVNLVQPDFIFITMLTVQLPLSIISVQYGLYLTQAGIDYQKYLTGIDTRQVQRSVLKESNESEERLQLAAGNTYAADASLPKLDKQREFAIALLRTRQEDEAKVDLTERRWVITSHKFIRKEFAMMMKNWQLHEIVRRKTVHTNSPYIVADWGKVRLIANGEPLPHHPDLFR